MDFVKPGIVDWKKRVNTADKMSKIKALRFQQILENCNYAVELGKKLNLVLVGIGGKFPFLMSQCHNVEMIFVTCLNITGSQCHNVTMS